MIFSMFLADLRSQRSLMQRQVIKTEGNRVNFTLLTNIKMKQLIKSIQRLNQQQLNIKDKQICLISYKSMVFTFIQQLSTIMKKPYTLPHIIILLTALTGIYTFSQGRQNSYQAGIEHFYPGQTFDQYQSSLFTISYKNAYSNKPMTIVAPLAFQIRPDGNQNGLLSTNIKLNIHKQMSGKVEVVLQINSIAIYIIKVSYLIIQEQIWRSQSFYLPFQSQSTDQNTFLTLQNQKQIKMKQISYERNLNKATIIKEYSAVIPFSSSDYEAFIFTRQLRIVQGKQYQFNLSVTKIMQTIQITYYFTQDTFAFKKFPLYQLILKEQHYEQTELSPINIHMSFSFGYQDITTNKAIFIGLTAFYLEQSSFQLSFNISNIENKFYVKGSKAKLSFMILQLNEDSSSWQKKDKRLLLVCASPTYVTQYENHWTTWIDPTNKKVDSCQACPTGCYSCTYCSSCWRFVNCTLCRPGFNYGKFTYKVNNQYVCTCASGYPNATTNTCMKCNQVIPNCVSCVSYGSGHYSATCANCIPGYFAVKNTGSWGGYTSCASCTPGCTSCVTNTSCNSCTPGLTKVSGVCYCPNGLFYSTITSSCTTCALALTNCTSCVANSTTTTCSACATGFFISTSGTCSACPSNCNSCTAITCTNCSSPFIVSNSSCACNASASMFLNTTSNTCVSCSTFFPSCSLCINNGTLSCSSCLNGTFLNDSSCISCPSQCTSCSSSSTCLSCTSNLVVINGSCSCDSSNDSFLNTLTTTCFSCSQILTQCATCSYNSSSSSVSCLNCSSGYYLSNDTTCSSCPATCSNCTDYATCGDCILGYQLSLTYQCECIDCANCDSLNLTNCSLCLNNGTATCTQCIVGSYLDNSSNCQTCPVGCATCNSSTACSSCDSPFVPSNPVGQCVCNSLLLQYYNPLTLTCDSCSNIVANCTSCSTSNYTTICSACQSNQYVENNTCFACPYPCTACTSSTACSLCTTTYILVNGTCTCDNSSQIFFNSLTNLCSSCITITTVQCLQCSVDPLATSSSGIKCTSCLAGYFPDSGTYLCSSCPSTCTACGDLSTCTECKSTFILDTGKCICETTNGFYLYGQICLPCFSIINYCQGCQNSTGSIKCTACGQGTYLSTSNDSCLLCPINCAACNSTGCTQCSIGYNLDASGICVCSTTCINFTSADPSCVDCNLFVNTTDNTSALQCFSCKSKTFLVNNQSCNSCPDSCATCTDYVNCLTCAVGFTLITNNCVCNNYFNQVLIGSVCQSCGSLVTGCQSCTYASGATTCNSCIEGWGIQSNGSCTLCGTGCSSCSVTGGVPTCTACYDNFNLSSGCSNNTICNNSVGVYYNTINSSCSNCMDNCQVCYTVDKCITCKPTFRYLKGMCVCDNGRNYYLDLTLGNCTVCQSALDNSSNLYLVNCLVCQSSNISYSNGIECLECADGYYLSAGTCLPCLSGCQKCTGSTSCCSCTAPAWIMNNGICVCDNSKNYFDDGNSSCQTCVIANCTVCSNLTTCVMCNLDSFVNSSGVCQLSVCGNSVIEGIETCDDGNLTDGDGCSSTCQIETFYFCINSPPPSLCYYDNRFNIQINEIVASCNQVTLKFKIYPFYDYYNSANYDHFLQSYDLNFSTLVKLSQSNDIVSYSFTFDSSIQSYNSSFVFDPSALGINETVTYPPNYISFSIVPTNNVLAVYYESNICDSMESLKKATQAIQYISYGTLFLSALPCKIVGLQLFGVIQLAFMSLGSMDNVNILMTPMMDMKGVNGYSMDLGTDASKNRLLQSSQSVTPQRLNTIGYKANFLRNCNVMLILVTTIILISFVLFVITYLCKSCSLTLHSISKRLIKEVLLTLILFNCLNFAYSVGLHFRYATKEDSLYTLGTLAAVATLVIPIIMAIGLSMAQEDGFGEFKDKFKKGCIEKAYFVITIAYRMSLGLYMSTSNEDELSTLIVLAISILFLMYNLVNLPYTKAYHNYRANVCHFTQFICLFVTMYYRSMKSSSSSDSVSNIYSPVYLEYTAIFISLVVSLVVLTYEIYIWIKECLNTKKQEKKVINKNQSEGDVFEEKKLDNNSKTEENLPQIFSNAYDEYD